MADLQQAIDQRPIDGPDIAGIPAEAVEAAAQVLNDLLAGGNGLGNHWIKILPNAREHYRRQVTPILAAALPHIRTEILAEVDAAPKDKP